MAQLSGTVKSGSDPLYRVDVNVDGRSTRTSKNGYYRIQRLSMGDQVATFKKDGYKDEERIVEIAPHNNVLNINMIPNSEPTITVKIGQVSWA